MAISLYDVSVLSFLQVVGAVEGVLDRGLAHCHEMGVDPQDMVNARLIETMAPLSFQIRSVAHHSFGAIEAVRSGLAGPPQGGDVVHDSASLQKLVTDAKTALQAVTPDEINALEGKPVTFALPNFKLPFTAEGYLMSFALPNLHFHATTAYDILRMKGAPLGKRDYLGAMRLAT